MERYVCVHGHYYQPPRENPWLEAIEAQEAAYPYHDWNERINAECYGPNGDARILGPDGRIARITNNYGRISFNFGPTLLSWLQEKAPETYASVLEGDRESRERFSGHGSALAQVYNHMILPLANGRDRRTQVLWGIRDFRHRFGRRPEGIWLPETAVDIETLELLAEHEIKFTILAPRQASRVRRMDGRSWRDVSGGRIDPSRAYLQRLPSGRRISLFFYDGPVSQGVAFEGLLRDGAAFADRLTSVFSDARTWPQLAHIATDGESYGHHHRFGEMALAFALDHVETRGFARLTNYGEFLERHPADHYVEIFENSSWSCEHGIERWHGDCGCSSGAHPEWNQSWRAPLREALDWLRDTLAEPYEREGRALFRSPWDARDAYIDVILDRSPQSLDRFFAAQCDRPLTAEERVRALKLLELQRHAMLMYTSCGWFFDDLTGIETVQVIQYAARAVQLAREVIAEDLEPAFTERLARARSNIAAHGDGASVYAKMVRPAMIDLAAVSAHYAINTLFDAQAGAARVYAYEVRPDEYRSIEAGRAKAAIGKVSVTSVVTAECAEFNVGVVHFGDHVVSGGVRPYRGPEAFDAMKDEVVSAFSRSDLAEAILVLDRHFSPLTYSLRSLFRDEQRAIVRKIVDPALSEAEALHRAFYERNASLMRFLADMGIPLPRRFHLSAELALNMALRAALDAADVDPARARALYDEAASVSATLDDAGLGFALTRAIDRLAEHWRREPADLERLARLDAVAALATDLPFSVNLWRAQNAFWEVAQSGYPQQARDWTVSDDGLAWTLRFRSLGDHLRMHTEDA